MTDLLQTDIPNEPVDSNGNHLEDYQQHDVVSRFIDGYRPIGVDSRGVFVFGSEEEGRVLAVRLTVGGDEIETMHRNDMFGETFHDHLREIAVRYDKWRWIPVRLQDT